MNTDLLKSVEEHEGFREKPYEDTRGLLTVGIGRCLETNPLTGPEWGYLIAAGLATFSITHEGATWLALRQLNDSRALLSSRLDWFSELSELRQNILIEMHYQMGPGFFTFVEMFRALNDHDYARAAKHGLNSKWAKKDSPKRAREMMKRMESGE